MGKSVFNSEEKQKQKQFFTPLKIYKNERTHEFRDDPGSKDMVELFQEFYELHHKHRRFYKDESKIQFIRSP